MLHQVRTTNHPGDVLVGQPLEILLHVELQVSTAQPGIGVPIPKATLHATEQLEVGSLHGTHIEACAADRVVDTQAALFVGAKHKAAAKLVVEITHGDIKAIAQCLDIDVGHAPAVETGVIETGQRVFQIFGTHTSLDMLAGQAHLSVGIGQSPIIICTRTYFMVFLGYQDIALYATVHSHFVLLCIYSGNRQSCQEQGKRSID